MSKELTKPDLNEVASYKSQPFNSSFDGLLSPEDFVLMESNKNYKAYDRLELDPEVKTAFNKRKMAIGARNWEVKPASKNDKDIKIAEFVRDNFKNINLNHIAMKLADAVFKGFSAGEIMWERTSQGIKIQNIKLRQQDRFNFDEDGNLRLKTKVNYLKGEVVPERKFIVHTCGDKYDNPYGVGLGQNLYWLVFFKNQDMQFWLKFLEKFGNPTVVGKYSTESEKVAIENAVRMIQNDTGLVVPKDAIIEILQNDAKNSTDSYKVLLDYLDKQIVKLILGETLTTDVGNVGSKAAGSVHNDVRLELVRSDLNLLAETLNTTLIKWLVDFNFDTTVYPKIHWIVEEKEDLNARADRDKKLFEMGYQATEEYIEQTYGKGFERVEQFKEVESKEFSDPEEKELDLEDQIVEETSKQAGKIIDSSYNRLKHIVKTSKTLEQVSDRIDLEFKDLSGNEFAYVMQDAMLLADLVGQDSADSDTKD
ncbi:MAG: DUF935 family protein [Proteobacteria bacterium]|nr:DUF935 family protein [Pseudomonadota bacterium]